MTRYILRYTTPEGRRIELFNLASVAVEEITSTQRRLGARDFTQVQQPHHYTPEEIALFTEVNAQRSLAEWEKRHHAAEAAARRPL